MTYLPIIALALGALAGFVWMALALGALLTKLGGNRAHAWIPVMRWVAAAKEARLPVAIVAIARGAAIVGVLLAIVAFASVPDNAADTSGGTRMLLLAGLLLWGLGSLVGWVMWIYGSGTIEMRLRAPAALSWVAAVSPPIWASILGWGSYGAGRRGGDGALATGDRDEARDGGHAEDAPDEAAVAEAAPQSRFALGSQADDAPAQARTAGADAVSGWSAALAPSASSTPLPGTPASASAPSAPSSPAASPAAQPNAPTANPAGAGAPLSMLPPGWAGAPAAPHADAGDPGDHTIAPPHVDSGDLTIAPTPEDVPAAAEPAPAPAAEPEPAEPAPAPAAEPEPYSGPVSPYANAAPAQPPTSDHAGGPETGLPWLDRSGLAAPAEAADLSPAVGSAPDPAPQPAHDDASANAPVDGPAPAGTAPADVPEPLAAAEAGPAPDAAPAPVDEPVPAPEQELKPEPSANPVPPEPAAAPSTPPASAQTPPAQEPTAESAFKPPANPAPSEPTPAPAPQATAAQAPAAPLSPLPPPASAPSASEAPAAAAPAFPPAASVDVAAATTATAAQTASAALAAAAAQADEGDEDDRTVIAKRRREVWVLEVVGGERYPLPEGPVVIGRASGAASPGRLGVDDTTRTMSKVHAELQYADGSWWVRDLGSTNGTYVRVGDEERQITGDDGARVDGLLLLGDLEVKIVKDEAS